MCVGGAVCLFVNSFGHDGYSGVRTSSCGFALSVTEEPLTGEGFGGEGSRIINIITVTDFDKWIRPILFVFFFNICRPFCRTIFVPMRVQLQRLIA